MTANRVLAAAKRLFARLSMLFTVTCLILLFTPVAGWYARLLAGPWNDPDGDILIVLTSDEQPDGIIGLASYGRAVYAVRAWREGHFRAVVVCGGNTKGGHASLAAVMGQFLVAYGIPKEKVFLEERSTTTRENAFFTKALIASWPGKRVLLTSDFHMFRAYRTFEAVGLEVSPRPFPDVLKHQTSRVYRLSDSWGLLLETAKIGYYWERGWIHLP